jgi:hypothetical protein
MCQRKWATAVFIFTESSFASSTRMFCAFGSHFAFPLFFFFEIKALNGVGSAADDDKKDDKDDKDTKAKMKEFAWKEIKDALLPCIDKLSHGTLLH